MIGQIASFAQSALLAIMIGVAMYVCAFALVKNLTGRTRRG